MRHKWFCLVLALLCLGAMLFSGCQENEPENTEPIITWDSIPQLTHGQMEAEKLSVLPWYSGRTETSTFHQMVETELGYYMIYSHQYLFYADKADLTKWMPVCNQPDCNHKDDITCRSRCESWVWMRDGRLYFRESAGRSPQLYQTEGSGYIIVSCLPDMTDKRLEFVNEESFIDSAGGFGAAGIMQSALMGNCIVDSITDFDEKGNETCNWFIYDENGSRKLQSPGSTNFNVFMGDSNNFLNLNGELCLCYGNPSGYSLYRMVEDTFVELNVDSDLLTFGGYLSGNTVRYFKENEGYYDCDLVTGESVLVSAPYRENSFALILAPNCIIETNMLYSGVYAQLPQGSSWLAVFDGECWRDVQLPPELSTPSDDHMLYVDGITSDSILVRVYSKRNPWQHNFYRIPIGEGQLHLEYCCDIEFLPRQ